MAGFGWPEILIVLVIVVLIFGVGKVADVGPALGKAISGFKRAVQEEDEPKPEEGGQGAVESIEAVEPEAEENEAT